MAFGENHFQVADYIVLSLTLLASLCIGVYFGIHGTKTNEEMLVGGRSMKVLPVAISMLVTYFSASSVLGYPGEVYAYGTQYFFSIVITCVFVPLSMIIFIRIFYEMKLTSIFEYLELRFDSIWVRWLSSFTFIVQLLFLNAVNLFAPAIALEAIFGFPVWFSVTLIGIICTIYTAMGGIKAVIWTDVFQFFMILVGLGAIVVKAFIEAGGVSQAFKKAGDRDRLEFFNWSIDPYMRQNTFNYVFGVGFQTLTMYGTHQPLVQRYSSLPSAFAAMKSLLLSVPLSFVTFIITLVTGICAVATYAGCDPILLGKISYPDAIIPYFVVEELSFIPGMVGIFVSCIFSAVLSTISSQINSLAAVTWEDFLSKIPYFSKMGSAGQAMSTKVSAAIYGAISIGLAIGSQNLGTIFQLGFTATGATSGPMGALFLCGLFVPFMNKQGAIGGIVVGFGSMMFLAIQAFRLSMDHNLYPRLPTDLSECPPDTDFSNAVNYTAPVLPDFDYPEKLYSISYLLYPTIGAIITTIAGIIISGLTGGFSTSHKVEQKYIHPWIRSYSCTRRFTGDDEADILEIGEQKYKTMEEDEHVKSSDFGNDKQRILR